MNVKSIEQWNNGYVPNEYRQNAIHKFCAAVEWESEYCKCSITEAYYKCTLHFIAIYSTTYTKVCGVIPVSERDDILSYFFNPQKDIPLYIFFWFDKYYSHKYAPISKYTDRHYSVYNELQKEYIQLYRIHKQSQKENAQILK